MKPRNAAAAVVVALAACACAVAPARRRPATADAPGLFQDVAAAADSGEPGPKFDTFSLRLGGQAVARFQTTLRLDSERLGRGTEVRLERDLGFNETTEFGRVDLDWRFNRSHAVEFSYYGFSRRASRRIDRDIQWGDRVFAIDTEIYAIFQSQTYKLAYRYTFDSGDDWEIGGSIGLHAVQMRSAVGIAGSRLEVGEEFKAVAPLPVLGLRGTWEPWPDFRLTGQADLFYIKLAGIDKVDEVEGFLADVLVAAEYDLLENFAVGVGANYFRIHANVGNDLLRLSADYDYVGGLVFGRLSF